ncbi:MAG: SurA N-terminal domain-containing protein [Elusimicrobiota bacterium]
MISFLSKHKKIIFGFTVVIFVIGVFFGLGAYVFSWGDYSSVAQVGKTKIPYETFRNQVNRVMKNMREQGAESEVSAVMEKTVNREVLREMIMEEVLAQEAAKLKLYVSDFEVAAEIQSTPQFFMEKSFHPAVYVRTIWDNFRMTPSQYEEWRRKARMGNKLKQFIYSAMKAAPDEIKDFYAENKGKPGEFEKKKEEYAQKLRQKNFMEAANYMLRQTAMKTEIKSYLEQIEKRAGGEA